MGPDHGLPMDVPRGILGKALPVQSRALMHEALAPRAGWGRGQPARSRRPGRPSSARSARCARRTTSSIEIAHANIHKTACRKGQQVKSETLRFARYVIVFTAYAPEAFPVPEVLECHRLGRQVKLVFKRFKSIARLGHLPKHDDESAKALLHGKLLVEKAARHALATPLGNTTWHKDRTPSPRRDFKFALN